MTYVAVKDLKHSSKLWKLLDEEQELVITRDGKPQALMVPVRPDSVERSLTEIRRARFSAALDAVRMRAKKLPPVSDEDVEAEVRAVREAK